MATRRWVIPEGLRVGADGRWTVGEHQVLHPPTLRHLKSHLVFEGTGAFVVDGPHRVPVAVEGPAFEVVSLVVDEVQGAVRVVLDDGTHEALGADGFRMGDGARFECLVRGGRARAVLSRGAHQALLQRVELEAGRFVLRAGPSAIPVRT